jgi:hypothetical protein
LAEGSAKALVMEEKGTVQSVRICGSSLIVEGYLYRLRADGEKMMIESVRFPVSIENAHLWFVGREFTVMLKLA